MEKSGADGRAGNAGAITRENPPEEKTEDTSSVKRFGLDAYEQD